MDGLEHARRAYLDITLAGANITRDIAPYLISFEYSDNKSGEADSISITLEDRDGRFIGDWFPKRNSIIEATIRAKDWKKHGDSAALKCGTFTLDEIEASQGIIQLKAVSAPVTAGGRRERETRTWEKIQLKTLARDIAAKAGLKLNYATKVNPQYGRVDQKQESGLEFLSGLVRKAGLAIKIVEGKLSIYSEVEAEKEKASLTIKRTGGRVISWSFKTQSTETYKSCEVGYTNPKFKKTIKGAAFTPEDDAPSGQVLKVNKRVENQAEAKALAKTKLRDANKREVTGSLDVVGDTRLLDGVVIAVEGFGTFDGKYRIASSSHSIGSGYVTHCELESGPPTVRSGGKGERKAKGKGKGKKKSAGADKFGENLKNE